MSDKIDEDAATFTATHTKKEVDLAQKLWLEKPNKHMSDTLVTNYDEVQELKGQLAELRQMLAELHEVNAELHKEIAELQK